MSLIPFFIAFLAYKNRWRLRLRWYRVSKRGKRFLGQLRTTDRHVNYGAINENMDLSDAYISCSEQDKPWVLQHLLPGIDNDGTFGGQFKLYFDDRDSEPGKCLFMSSIVKYIRRNAQYWCHFQILTPQLVFGSIRISSEIK